MCDAVAPNLAIGQEGHERAQQHYQCDQKQNSHSG